MDKKLLTTATIAALAFSFVAPANASEVVPQIALENIQGSDVDNFYDEGVSDEELAEAVEKAAMTVGDPVADPKGFEAAIQKELRGRNAEDSDSHYAPRVAPLVVIGARIGMCVASAYPAIAELNNNDGYARNAALIGNIVASCIGGGTAGPMVAKWIMKNPRTFANILNAIGLGHLASDSTRNG